jgi:hypothetical protein
LYRGLKFISGHVKKLQQLGFTLWSCFVKQQPFDFHIECHIGILAQAA